MQLGVLAAPVMFSRAAVPCAARSPDSALLDGIFSTSRAGADVVLADLPDRQAELAAVAAKVEDLGRTATAVPIDVRNKEAVDAAMAHVAT